MLVIDHEAQNAGDALVDEVIVAATALVMKKERAAKECEQAVEVIGKVLGPM